MKKNIIAILIVFFSFIIGLSNVQAKTGERITIDSKTYIQTGFGTRTEAKFHTTKGYAWCITPHKTGANQGTILYYKGQETNGGTLYLLDRAGTSDSQYLETQLALWIYDSKYLPAIYEQNSNSTVVKNAKILANEASKNANYKVEPSITLDAGGNTILSLAKIGDKYYYQTNTMSARLVNASSYTVSLENAPSGAYIANTNGTATNTFKNGEKFTVRIPETSINASVKFNVVAKTSGTKKYVERYTPENSNLQEVVLLRQENVTLSTKKEMTISPTKKYCQLFNGRYYGTNGTVVSAEQYKKECVHTCTQYNGNYYGLNNTIVSYEQYKKECVHTCTQYNGSYYGENGNVVTYDQYKKECVHTCTQYNGKYYGSNGSIVSAEEYRKQCVHTCTQYNGNYYGLNNTIVPYEQYKNECIHTCTQYNGSYYGSNSTVVTESEYKKQCEGTTITSVPSTGTNSDMTNIIAGLCMIVGGTGITIGYRKEKNIR